MKIDFSRISDHTDLRSPLRSIMSYDIKFAAIEPPKPA